MSSLAMLHDDQHRSAGNLDWLDAEVPCATGDGELWFAETPEGVAQAQRLCAGCQLRVSCLAGALQRREPWGVWGGELFERGVPVARKRRPGRPRKDDDHERQRAEQALVERLGRAPDLDLDLDLLLASDEANASSGGAVA